MKEFIKKFTTHEDYEEYITGDSVVLPNVSYCEDVKDVHYNPYTWENDYLSTIALENGTISFTPQEINVISYSTDNGNTWTEGNSVNVVNGAKILWKGTMTPSSNGIGSFSATTCDFDVKGNVMSLIYGDDFKNQLSLEGKVYCFKYLFSKSKVVSVENLILPATTLAQSCYYSMFSGCTSLTTAPELPATTLAEGCYYYMFDGCTSLTSAPQLPATTLAAGCYYYMFNGCTGLTSAPTILPATTLAENCYGGMFKGCTSLTTAPQLPATTLTISCYDCMFRGCTSLTSAPQLPATTLAAGCYQYMFSDCTSLNYINAMFTTTPSSPYTYSWVSGVAASGKFVKNSAASWDVRGNDGIPEGWTVQTA